VITIPAVIESVSTRRDKTYKVILGTQEMTPAEGAAILSLHQKECYVAIKAETFTKQESKAIESLKTDDITIKTPSQRLRNVFYVMWQQSNDGYEDFTSFYAHKMERVIEFYKSKLEPA
jgi:hypothetical protein